MAKDTYYFSHDYNARQDEKIKRLLRKHKCAGYGIYWCLVEDLYNNANALELDCEGIAFDLHEDIKMVESVINDFGLFVITNKEFGSSSIERRLDERNEKSKKAQKSAFKRWNKYKEDANALHTDNDSNAIKKEKEINKEKKESTIPHTGILGIDYVKAYSDLPDDFKEMYDEIFYKSWLNINKHISENCKYLRTWTDQITIKEFKSIYDRIDKKEITINQVRQALTDLDGSRIAKEKYNSVFHGFNTYLKTILKNV